MNRLRRKYSMNAVIDRLNSTPDVVVIKKKPNKGHFHSRPAFEVTANTLIQAQPQIIKENSPLRVEIPKTYKPSKLRRVVWYMKRAVKKGYRIEKRKLRFGMRVAFKANNLAARGVTKVTSRTYKGCMKSIKKRLQYSYWVRTASTTAT